MVIFAHRSRHIYRTPLAAVIEGRCLVGATSLGAVFLARLDACVCATSVLPLLACPFCCLVHAVPRLLLVLDAAVPNGLVPGFASVAQASRPVVQVALTHDGSPALVRRIVDGLRPLYRNGGVVRVRLGRKEYKNRLN